MRVHLKRDTRALERALETIEGDVIMTKAVVDREAIALVELKAKRTALTLSQKVPLDLIKRLDRASRCLEHATYCWDKACETRNALRSLINAGRIEL